MTTKLLLTPENEWILINPNEEAMICNCCGKNLNPKKKYLYFCSTTKKSFCYECQHSETEMPARYHMNEKFLPLCGMERGTPERPHIHVKIIHFQKGDKE